MASKDSDEPSFADEMERLGVTPLGRARTGKRRPDAVARGAAKAAYLHYRKKCGR